MTVTVIGNPGRFIRRFVSLVERGGQRKMHDALKDVREWASAYPPQSEANRPRYGGHGPYYIRGVGSAYARQDGGLTVYHTSEQLGDSWKDQVTVRPGVVEGRTGPTASYGPYVHRRRQQARFHRKRGWRTIEDALVARRRSVYRIFAQMTRNAIRLTRKR